MKSEGIYFLCLLLVFCLGGGGMLACSDSKDHLKSSEFPIPYPDGGAVITDEWNGVSGYRTVRYPAGHYTQLLAFYDDYASGNGWKRTESGQGTTLSVVYVHLSNGYTIDFAPPDDQVEGGILVSLYVVGH